MWINNLSSVDAVESSNVDNLQSYIGIVANSVEASILIDKLRKIRFFLEAIASDRGIWDTKIISIWKNIIIPEFSISEKHQEPSMENIVKYIGKIYETWPNIPETISKLDLVRQEERDLYI